MCALFSYIQFNLCVCGWQTTTKWIIKTYIYELCIKLFHFHLEFNQLNSIDVTILTCPEPCPLGGTFIHNTHLIACMHVKKIDLWTFSNGSEHSRFGFCFEFIMNLLGKTVWTSSSSLLSSVMRLFTICVTWWMWWMDICCISTFYTSLYPTLMVSNFETLSPAKLEPVLIRTFIQNMTSYSVLMKFIYRIPTSPKWISNVMNGNCIRWRKEYCMPWTMSISQWEKK